MSRRPCNCHDTRLDHLAEKISGRIYEPYKSNHEARMYALMGEWDKELRKGVECPNCHTYHEELTEPITMRSGKVRPVCALCLAELKPSAGRVVYVKR